MNHYLPEDLAKQAGMTRTEVIELCPRDGGADL